MAATTETPQQKAARLFRVYLDTRTEGAFVEWLDANRAAGESDDGEDPRCR